MPALLPALALPLWVVVSVPASIPPGPMIALTVTGVASAFISPIQDHLRRMLHIGGASWLAAAVSLVQIIVVVGAIAALVANHIPPAWGPFGALALANGVSLTFGLLAARRRWNPAALLPDVRLSGIVRSGGWLLSSSLIPTGAAFIASAIVAHQAGPALLGYAEVARLSGQPLLVLATGLSATLGPQIMAAAQGREARPANRIARNFIALILVVGVAYIALVGHDWSWNPLRILLPKAYTIHGLVLATILANLVLGAAFPFRSEVIGAGREKMLANIEATGSTLRVLISGGAGVLGAFAIPLGILAMGVVRLVGCRMTLRSYYAKAVR
jgi:O-antigen/teichoic acid export membrane protein